ARAVGARVGVSGLIDFMEKHQAPGAGATEPDAWGSVEAALALMERTDDREWRGAVTNGTGTVYPEFTYLFRPDAPPSETPEERAARGGQTLLARRLIEKYREAGVFARLDEMAARRRAMPVLMPIRADEPLFNAVFAGSPYGKMRGFAR